MSPTTNVTLPELAAALIAVFEGERLTAYRDSGGVLTIGIGHTGPQVYEGLRISAQDAALLFAKDQAPLLALLAGVPLLEAAALASFGFNCGRGALELVLGGHDTVANPKHTTDRHGTVLPGLVARRRLEEMLMLVSQQMERKGVVGLDVPGASGQPGARRLLASEL